MILTDEESLHIVALSIVISKNKYVSYQHTEDIIYDILLIYL